MDVITPYALPLRNNGHWQWQICNQLQRRTSRQRFTFKGHHAKKIGFKSMLFHTTSLFVVLHAPDRHLYRAGDGSSELKNTQLVQSACLRSLLRLKPTQHFVRFANVPFLSQEPAKIHFCFKCSAVFSNYLRHAPWFIKARDGLIPGRFPHHMSANLLK